LEAQVDSTEPTISIKIEDFRNREFLTVTQVSKLIGCSRQNVYKLIRYGKLQATNLLEKKTIIKRKDLDEMFDNLKIQKVDKQLDNFSVADCYTLSEVVGKYDISEKALYEYIKRNNIPTLKEGWFVYVPKSIMDNIFGF
jgi:excisionase family DNA binding protein